jgi:hypothetical protein
MNSGITMVVCSPWECSSFLVQLFWLVSGGFVSKTIQTGRIEVDCADPSSFQILSEKWGDQGFLASHKNRTKGEAASLFRASPKILRVWARKLLNPPQRIPRVFKRTGNGSSGRG